MKTFSVMGICMLMSGCVLSHHSHLHYKGTSLSTEQVAQITPGKTDKQWILDNLGTPDRIHAEKGGREIYEYVGKTVKKSDTDFILLFSWDSEKIVEDVVTRIVMMDGIVESVEMSDTNKTR